MFSIWCWKFSLYFRLIIPCACITVVFFWSELIKPVQISQDDKYDQIHSFWVWYLQLKLIMLHLNPHQKLWKKLYLRRLSRVSFDVYRHNCWQNEWDSVNICLLRACLGLAEGTNAIKDYIKPVGGCSVCACIKTRHNWVVLLPFCRVLISMHGHDFSPNLSHGTSVALKSRLLNFTITYLHA